jgi:hypothetical protein
MVWIVFGFLQQGAAQEIVSDLESYGALVAGVDYDPLTMMTAGASARDVSYS